MATVTLVHKQQPKPLTNLDAFQELLNSANQQPESTPTRTVRLLRKTSCGCTDFVDEIIRTVPASSPLRDGDIVTDYVDGDAYAN